MGMMGQKHTHTEADFERWSKDIPPKNLIEIKANQPTLERQGEDYGK